MVFSAAETSSRHFFGPLSTSKMSGHTQADEPVRYNLKPRQVGRDTGIKASSLLLHHLTERVPTFEPPGIRDTCIS